MNKVILMGRITKDLEVRQTQSGSQRLPFTIAVDRAPARQGEERQTDFISCVAFGQRAEFIKKYFGKGRMIAIEGNIRTGSYEKDGVRHYTTDVWVDSVYFTGEPRQEGSHERNYTQPSNNNYNDNYSQQSEPKSDVSIGSLKDYEDVIGDDNAPF